MLLGGLYPGGRFFCRGHCALHTAIPRVSSSSQESTSLVQERLCKSFADHLCVRFGLGALITLLGILFFVWVSGVCL